MQVVLVNYFVCEWCNWHHMCWDWEQNDCCQDNLVYAVFLVSENSSNSWMSRAEVDYLHESYLLISPCRPQMPQTKRLWHLLKVLRNHQWASRTLLYLFQLNSLLQPKSKHFAKWVYFSACIFSSCFHLQLSFSFFLAFSLCPSLQLHHSYPALAPAVTLKQLSTVTMVMHTTVLDFCCHLIIIIITVTTVNVRLRDLSQSSDPSLICIMWRMALNAEPRQAGWVSCLSEKWSADVELSNWKKLKHGHWKRWQHASMCMCVLFAPRSSSSSSFSWLPAVTDILFFFPSLVGVSSCLCVFTLDDLQKFSLQLHASLSPRALLLAARAKGNS